MRNLVIVIPILLLFAACQPNSQPEAVLDMEAAEQQVRDEAMKDDVREAMMRVLRPDPAQRTALDEAYESRDEEFGAWLHGEKGKRLIALEARMRVEAKESDLAEFRRVIAEATPLRKELIGLLKSHQQNILDTLTPTQKLQWAGYEVSSAMLELMEPLALAPDQIAVIEEGAPEAVSQAEGRGASNPKAEAYLELEKWVESQVLSKSQAADYVALKESKPMRSLTL